MWREYDRAREPEQLELIQSDEASGRADDKHVGAALTTAFYN